MTRYILYLSVLPMVHISSPPFASYGRTEQVLTLFPDRNFATEFMPDEVDEFIETFRSRASSYLTGGRITGYDFEKEVTKSGLVIVKVIQNAR